MFGNKTILSKMLMCIRIFFLSTLTITAKCEILYSCNDITYVYLMKKMVAAECKHVSGHFYFSINGEKQG